MSPTGAGCWIARTAPGIPSLRLFRQSRLGDWEDVLRAYRPGAAGCSNLAGRIRPVWQGGRNAWRRSQKPWRWPSSTSKPVTYPRRKKSTAGFSRPTSSYAEAHNNLGAVLAHLGRPQEAVACLPAALRDSRNSPRPAAPWPWSWDNSPAARHLLHCPRPLTTKRGSPIARASGWPDRTGLPRRQRTSHRRCSSVPISPTPTIIWATCFTPRANTIRPWLVSGGAALQPDLAIAYSNLGNVCKLQGRPDEAVAYYHQAIRLNPNLAEPHNNMASALVEQDKFAEAAACYRQAVRLKPDYTEAHTGLGDALRELGQFAEAAASCRRALELRPNDAGAYSTLGLVLLDQHRAGSSRGLFRGVPAPEARNMPPPTITWAWRSRTRASWTRPRLTSARRSSLQPDFAKAFNNLGIVLGDQGRPDEAVTCYDQALHFEGHYGEPRWNRALVRLRQGDFERGWADYESRWGCREFPRPQLSQPLWDGSPLRGRTIVLHAEQGLGRHHSVHPLRAPGQAARRQGDRDLSKIVAPALGFLLGPRRTGGRGNCLARLRRADAHAKSARDSAKRPCPVSRPTSPICTPRPR